MNRSILKCIVILSKYDENCKIMNGYCSYSIESFKGETSLGLRARAFKKKCENLEIPFAVIESVSNKI